MPPKAPTSDDTAPGTITFRDLALRVAPSVEWPAEAFEAFEDGKLISAVREILGDEQWAAVKALRPKPTLGEIGGLATSITSAVGLGAPGESPASSG